MVVRRGEGVRQQQVMQKKRGHTNAIECGKRDRNETKKNSKSRVPTRDISLLIGCNVGSSGINPAATMGITAVKILVRKGTDRGDQSVGERKE